jgi:uncharacterized protein YggE
MRRHLAVFLLALTTSLFHSGLYAEERPLINVSAEGSIKTKADMALISIDIHASELDADTARNKTDQQVKRLLKVLKDYEVKEGSLDTSQTTIHTEYDYNVKPKQLLAYRANRNISFGLTNLNQLEKLVKAVSQLEQATLNHIQFSVQDNRYWEDSALSHALQLAKSKAELIAQEFGVELASIYRVTHQVNRTQQPVFARAMSLEMDKSAANTYQQKDLEVSAFVEVSFNFK